MDAPLNKLIEDLERRVLVKLADCADGHEIVPSHPAIIRLREKGYIRLSDALLSPTGEKAKDGWAKITDEGRAALQAM